MSSVTPFRRAKVAPPMTAMDRLRAAGSNVLHRWRTPRVVERKPGERHLDALLVLALAASILLVALFADEAIARSVLGLPTWIVSFFARITYIGLHLRAHRPCGVWRSLCARSRLWMRV